MNKKEKIKKWFKEHFTKDKLMPWVLTALIFIIVLLCVYFENKDKKQMQNKTSDISLVETDENLNKSWSINQDGNLVGDNLCSDIVGSGFIIDFYMASILPDTTYAMKCYGFTPNTVNYAVTLYINDNAYMIIAPSGSYNTSIDSGFTFTTSSVSIPSSITSIYIKVQFNEYITHIGQCMINLGTTFKEWEPYGVWYSNTNYTQYGTNEYIKGLADNENQYYYFDNRSIKYYTSNTNELIATQNLTQNTYNNYSIDSIDYVESYITEHSVYNYYGIIDNLNILSKEFFVNINYSSPVYQGYVKIYYSNDTTYSVNPYDYNQNYYIYNGAETNSDLFISKIEFGFHYDDATAIIINTSPNVVLYQNGYNEGYKIGYNESSETFYQNGRTNGYNEGYQIGLNEGAQKDLYNNGMRTLFDSILSYPVNMLSSVFNFEFMGINIASTLFFLISCGIVLWIIKRLWK